MIDKALVEKRREEKRTKTNKTTPKKLHDITIIKLIVDKRRKKPAKESVNNTVSIQ